MRTASDPLRASRKRIAELRNLANVDLVVWAVWLIDTRARACAAIAWDKDRQSGLAGIPPPLAGVTSTPLDSGDARKPSLVAWTGASVTYAPGAH